MVKTEGIFLDLENLKILSCAVRNLWVVQRFHNFSEAFLFAQICGHVVALRSGFCEVISGANVNFHIIYNDLSHSTYSMKPIIKKNLTEYVFDGQPWDDLMNDILKSF